MSEDQNAVQILPVATNPNTDTQMAADLQRRFDREDQSAAIEVLTHRRREQLEEASSSRSKLLAKLKKDAEEKSKEISAAVLAHIDKLKFDKLENAAVSLNLADLGREFFAGVASVDRDDEEKKVTFTMSLVQLNKDTKDEVKAEMKETRQIVTGGRYHGYGHTDIGESIEVEVSFDGVEGLNARLEELKAINKQISKTDSELSRLQTFLVSLPQFQNELKVRLAENQLSESSRGQTFLKVIEGEAVKGFDDLVALPPAAADSEDSAE